MRIAFVAPFGLHAKGTARARALPLARALAGRGHDVAIFIPPYDSPADSGQCWSDAGVSIVNVALPPGIADGALWHLRLAWRLWRAVRGWQPAVVHIFKPKGPSGLVGTALWAMRRSRSAPRLVVDSDDWEGPGGWNDDPRAAYSPLQKRVFAWQERHGLAHADAWTVTSQCLRDRAIAFGADPARVFVLPNGVANQVLGIGDWGLGIGNSSAAPNPKSQIPNPKSPTPAILYTRFAGTRPADVAALWAQVRARLPGARLTVIGRGLAGEEQALRGLPGIEVAGWVEPERLPGLLAGAALGIVPWADTPSNRARHSAKVLELMAAGLPIVAYAVGELPSTLGDGGVLIPPGDTAAFAAAVAALLADPARAAHLGAAAATRLRTHFTWERLAETALAAYRAAAGNSYLLNNPG